MRTAVSGSRGERGAGVAFLERWSYRGSMIPVTCQACGKSLQASDAAGGKSVRCPHCQAVVPVPPSLPSPLPPRQIFPPPVPQFQQPVILVNTAAPQQPRLESQGWFSRSFSSASGVLLALLAFTAIVVGLPILFVCGGCLMLGASATKHSGEFREQQRVEDDAVKKLALPILKSRSNIVELSDECTVLKFGNGARIRGSGRDANGKVHSFVIEWDIAKFNGQETWQVDLVQIDGRNRQ